MAERTLNRRSRRRDESDEDQYDVRDARDDSDEEPPRRGRSRSHRDDDQDEAPRGRRSSRRDPDEDDEPRSRRSSRRGRDDADDEPRGRASHNTTKGWGGYKSKRQETSEYVKNYALPDKAPGEIIKIMDDEPFSVYSEHWLDEKQGKKSYVCIGEGCPLCAIGEKPRVYLLFNVLDLRDPDNGVIYPWKVSQTVGDVLEGFADNEKTSPINRDDLYFSIYKTGGGKKGRVQTNISPVKARDLLEDWDIQPFTAKELEEFDLYQEDDVLEFTSKKTLKAIADDLED